MKLSYILSCSCLGLSCSYMLGRGQHLRLNEDRTIATPPQVTTGFLCEFRALGVSIRFRPAAIFLINLISINVRMNVRKYFKKIIFITIS